MTRELRDGRVGVDQSLGEFLWMRGGVADTLDAGDFRDVFQEQRKVGAVARAILAAADAAAVRVHVLAEQGHLLHAQERQLRHFREHIFERARNFLAAGIGDDAEAAILATALHDGYKGRHALDSRRRQAVELLDLRKRNIDLRPAGAAARCNQLGQAVQGLRAEYHVDIRRARHDGGAFLAGDTAAHADDYAGTRALQVLHPAQVMEHFLLRLLAHRAGIEHNHVGFGRIVGGFHVLCRGEHVGHFGRVVFVHLAAERLDI